VRCPQCNTEHALLDPTFKRPDDIFALAAEDRSRRAFESDDVCSMEPTEGGARRHFVRCILPVKLTDVPDSTRWGLWAEVAEKDLTRVLALWDSPLQAEEPAFAALIANHVPDYPETIGLPVQMKLTGPNTRPTLALDAASQHAFAVECRSGVSVHRAIEWLKAMGIVE
jgi:hypothetical protein